MLLRASGEHHGSDIDLNLVIGGGEDDGGVPHGRLLVRFAEAVLDGDDAALAQVRGDLLEAMGAEALVDAAAVIGAYEALDRAADASGIPIDEERLAPSAGFRQALGIVEFPSARDA